MESFGKPRPCGIIVILALAAVCLFSVAGIIYLAAVDKAIPDSLNMAVGGSIGALAAILSRIPYERTSDIQRSGSKQAE